MRPRRSGSAEGSCGPGHPSCRPSVEAYRRSGVLARALCGVPTERNPSTHPYPGLHPGLVCSAPLGHPKVMSARPRGAPPTKTVAERCQAGASLGGEHPHPSRKARKIIVPRAYSASGGLIPRSPAHQNRRRSGIRPERALEANTPTPSRKARKLILLPRAYSASGGLTPRSPAHQNRSGAVSGRSEPRTRTPQPPRAKRES